MTHYCLKTKIVSIVGESNISGMLTEIKNMSELIKSKSNAYFIVDGAQLVPHRKVDVQKLGIDFLCVSGHKMLGPTGIGVVWGKKEILENMEPVYGGGDMIEEVFYESATWAPIPHWMQNHIHYSTKVLKILLHIHGLYFL